MRHGNKRVALIATGDELVNGDILNTNGQYFSRQFINNGIRPGNQITVCDDEIEIEQAIRYLLQDHDALITIGGLGPTSDDKTRYGLARALETELIFYDSAWQWLTELLKDKKLAIPETNRQQALLPINSTPIRNFNGTAAACYLNYQGKDIFMLPGPPNECLPLFDDFVLNKLIERNYAKETHRLSWLLLGVSESDIAALLQPIAERYTECQLGFRVSYPYLEIKLLSTNKKVLTALENEFNTLLAENCISRQRQTASQQLLHLLQNNFITLKVNDKATRGALETCLSTPLTLQNLFFGDCSLDKPHHTFTLQGLDNYWLNKPELKNASLELNIDGFLQNLNIPLRGSQTLTSAIERSCWQFLLHYRKSNVDIK